jgi:hypothetical protein
MPHSLSLITTLAAPSGHDEISWPEPALAGVMVARALRHEVEAKA